MGKFSVRASVCFIVLFLLAGLGLFKSDLGESQAVSRVVEEALGAKSAPAALDLLTADFEEAFVPTIAGADRRPLAAVLERYKRDDRRKSLKVDLLEEFLLEYPNDPWAPSVRLNLGLYYHRTNRFTRALNNLDGAWEALKDQKEQRLKALADHALGEYALTLAHLGRVEELEALLESTSKRSLTGASTELYGFALEGLQGMKSKPDYAFWCGPAALGSIGESCPEWSEKSLEILRAHVSTPRGTSLQQNQTISQELGMNYQMAFRNPGSAIVTPAVVHWRAGHFAAILKETSTDLYEVKDETGGWNRDKTQMDIQAIDEEASGYFLIPQGPLPSGWRVVSGEEGAGVWGRGFTGYRKDTKSTGDTDVVVPTSCPIESLNGGMTGWSVHAMLVSLRLKDTPVGLSPAAFSVPFTVTYAQREVNQPAVFDYANLGPKWTSNWTSHLTDHRAVNGSGQVAHYKAGGGTDDYEFVANTASSQRGDYTQAVLSDVGDGFRLDFTDGGYQEYLHLVGNRYHLSRVVDAQGNATVVEYDGLNRIATIRDAVGRAMTLEYDLPDDPLKITQVTDPFGRSASFAYTPDGHLASITDTFGMVSSYQYGANDFIHTLTTPYGTTTFSYGDVSTEPSLGVRRFLEIVDTEGRISRLESADVGPYTVSSSQVPSGMPLSNSYMTYRNSFYWEPHQLDAVPNYDKATVYHFLHAKNYIDGGWATGRTLESMKRPLENRVWYAYPNHRARIFSGNNNPTHIGRVLGDGTTQLTKYSYNSLSNITQTTDPAGRVFNYTYAPNEMDLTSVSTGGQSLFSATYDDNHNITSLIDASGGTSTFTYNSRGQVTSMTNPLGETTNYTYTLTGNLYTIEAPLQKVTTFLYDSAERVSTVVDSEGYSAQVTYDALDRPLSVTYPDGTTDTLTYDRLDVVASKDRLGRQTQMTYDSLGRVKSILDANGGTTSLGYGLVDSPTSLTDPNGNTTTFQFDL
ncbi:MAG: hypothetical protein WC423_26475, partial [Vulcanimicrobiota bacterium]